MTQLQQFANAEILIANWDQIRLSVGEMSPALAAEFTALGGRLQAPASWEELPKIIDDLLRLIRNTAAAPYVRQLMARAALEDHAATRSVGRQESFATGMEAPPAEQSSDAAKTLGSALAKSADPLGVTHVPIFYATNRKQSGTAFSGDPADVLGYGYVWVTVPARHEMGHIEKQPWWNCLSDPGDPRKYFTCEIRDLPKTEFLADMEKSCQVARSRQMLVFIHGFNVSFEEGAMRAAQFAHDTEFSGLVVLYSWPSRGAWYGYSADEARAGASGVRMAGFLNDLVGGPWAQLSFLAHSMGNRVLLSALADNERPKLSFGQLVMAAADVYVEDFKPQFSKLQQQGVLPCTSYSSRNDRALQLSSWIHRGPRVGLIGDFHFDDDDNESIDATAVDHGLLAHGYWSGERALITDIRTLVLDGFRAEKRGLRHFGGYWMFPR